MLNCGVCGLNERDHTAAEARGDVHHNFAGPGGGLQHVKGEMTGKKVPGAPVSVAGPPSDPVLRTILIEKGVITLEDIEKAERTLRATGVIRTHGNPS